MTSRVLEAVTNDYPPCPQCMALQGDPCRSPSSATCKPHGVGAPCPTCKPTRGVKTAVARAARRGPDWTT